MMKNDHLVLQFTTDAKTKVKMCGISGRRRGIDKEYFEVLDRDALENEDGFKIFLLHGALGEYKSEDLANAESMPISNLPKGFAYYACGHIHERFEGKEYGFNVAYPGVLFGADFADLEKSARGQERGFFIVNFGNKIEKIEFVPVSVCGYEIIEYDADVKTSVRVQREILELVTSAEPAGKIVLLKVTGEMSAGKTSDVDFQQFKRVLRENGAVEILANYHQLKSKEYVAIKVAGQNISEIEEVLFRENIGTIKVSKERLKGESGIKLSRDILAVLKQVKIENEAKTTYEDRISADTFESMGIESSFE